MTQTEELKEKLFRKTKSGWENLKEEKKQEIFAYAETYMTFLNKSKTEREIVNTAKAMAEEKGFKNIAQVEHLQVGDKIYYNN
ncbi:MAG: aminopeptidase, partial [Clostridia bacterium]